MSKTKQPVKQSMRWETPGRYFQKTFSKANKNLINYHFLIGYIVTNFGYDRLEH